MTRFLGNRKLLPSLLLGLLLVTSLLIGGVYLITAGPVLAHPYATSEVEGLVAYHYQQFRAAPNLAELYPDFAQYPYITNPYSPLYTMASAAVDVFTHPLHPFFAGRWVSLLSLGAILALLYAMVRRFSGSRLLALIACVWLLSDPAFLSYGFQVRPDLMALALAAGGAFLYLFGEKKHHRVLAGLLLAAAILTKQTAISVPISLLIWEIGVRRTFRKNLSTWVTFAATLLLSLLSLQILTGGHFWTQAITLNAAHIHLLSLTTQSTSLFIAFNGLLIWTAIVLFYAMPRSPAPTLRSNNLTLARFSLLWALVASCVFIATVGKMGSAINYWIEASFALTLTAFGFGSPYWQRVLMPVARLKHFLLPPLLIIVAFLFLYRGNGFLGIARQIARKLPDLPADIVTNEQIVSRIQASGLPYLADSPYFAPYTPDSLVLFDPLSYSLLTFAGKWDDQAFVESIVAKKYGLLIFDFGCRQLDGETRYYTHMHPNSCAAIEQSYKQVETLGKFQLYRARE